MNHQSFGNMKHEGHASNHSRSITPGRTNENVQWPDRKTTGNYFTHADQSKFLGGAGALLLNKTPNQTHHRTNSREEGTVSK